MRSANINFVLNSLVVICACCHSSSVQNRETITTAVNTNTIASRWLSVELVVQIPLLKPSEIRMLTEADVLIDSVKPFVLNILDAFSEYKTEKQ